MKIDQLTNTWSWISTLPSRQVAFFLFALILPFYSLLVLLNPIPFVFDEGTYALMIKEFNANPGLVTPAIAGEHVEWKPPLFTWVNSVFYAVFRFLPLPPEMIFRLPSSLFASINVALLFLIAEKMYERRVALISVLIFSSMRLIIFSATTVMMESFALLLILVSVYSYLNRKYSLGALALACLVLTKSLYILFPVIFILVYFLKDKDLKKMLLTFLSVPAALCFYLLIAFMFGSVSNAVANLAFDLIRPSPTINIPLLFSHVLSLFVFTFPFGLIAPLLVILKKPDLKKELPIILLCALGFLPLLSSMFLFWYLTPAIFPFSIFIARRLEMLDKGMFYSFILIGIFAMNFILQNSVPFGFGIGTVKDVIPYLQGDKVCFLEPHPHYTVWNTISDTYHGTNKSFLLLEQFNPGILYYMFGDTNDYSRLHVSFSEYNETPSCGCNLVVHTKIGDSLSYNWTLPDCYIRFWNNAYYVVYSPSTLNFSNG